jgi:hypothetical protein
MSGASLATGAIEGNSGQGGSIGDYQGGAISFGNITSGGTGGFNPFAKPGAGPGFASNPLNLVIIGGVVLGAAWLLKRK